MLTFCAVKPLQKPAFGSEHEKRQQGLNEEGMAVIEKLPAIKAHFCARKGKLRPLAGIFPIFLANMPKNRSCGRKHQVLLKKQGANIQPAREKQQAQQSKAQQ